MSKVRRRRLEADYRLLQAALADSSHVFLEDAQGDPPERYRLRFEVESLVIRDNEPVPKAQHLVEVFLTLAYPRQAPQCRMLTPIFHPNIAPHAICIGDHWSAGESLAALIGRIGELIAFQSYNIKSPLNGEAARWAATHADQLPLDRSDLSLSI